MMATETYGLPLPMLISDNTFTLRNYDCSVKAKHTHILMHTGAHRQKHGHTHTGTHAKTDMPTKMFFKLFITSNSMLPKTRWGRLSEAIWYFNSTTSQENNTSNTPQSIFWNNLWRHFEDQHDVATKNILKIIRTAVNQVCSICF